jgi:hypothetical protein
MSEKSLILKAFNTHFFEFVDDILRLFPDNFDLLTTKQTFEIIKRANPTAILKVWHAQVYKPYQTQIIDGNIDFFFEKDYGSDLGNVANQREIMRVIDTLRMPIQNMDTANKAHTMTYIQNLSKLSAMY